MRVYCCQREKLYLGECCRPLKVRDCGCEDLAELVLDWRYRLLHQVGEVVIVSAAGREEFLQTCAHRWRGVAGGPEALSHWCESIGQVIFGGQMLRQRIGQHVDEMAWFMSGSGQVEHGSSDAGDRQSLHVGHLIRGERCGDQSDAGLACLSAVGRGEGDCFAGHITNAVQLRGGLMGNHGL